MSCFWRESRQNRLFCQKSKCEARREFPPTNVGTVLSKRETNEPPEWLESTKLAVFFAVQTVLKTIEPKLGWAEKIGKWVEEFFSNTTNLSQKNVV